MIPTNICVNPELFNAMMFLSMSRTFISFLTVTAAYRLWVWFLSAQDCYLHLILKSGLTLPPFSFRSVFFSATTETAAHIKRCQSNSKSMEKPEWKYIRTEKSHTEGRKLEMTSEKGTIWIHKEKVSILVRSAFLGSAVKNSKVP